MGVGRTKGGRDGKCANPSPQQLLKEETRNLFFE